MSDVAFAIAAITAASPAVVAAVVGTLRARVRRRPKAAGSAGETPFVVTNVAGDVVEVRTRGVSAKAIGAPESSEAILAERQGGKLTERESQLLMLLAAGRTNREIAAHLNIAESTARVHVARLMDKVRDGLRERERPGPHRPSRSRSWEEIGESVSTAQEEQEPGAATDK